jgi:Zn finger protein HypA/HybF involved in hydrogenase expression
MRALFQLISEMAVIACRSCNRSFDKEAQNGFCPFCGADNN